MKRESKKIDATDFLALMCIESQKGSPSYNDLASRYETFYKKTPTKQAIWKRINQPCVLFFQSILARIIKAKVAKSRLEVIETISGYKRVIIQDSTIVKLPIGLFAVFSGVKNAHTITCNARIQGVYDLLSGTFISFSIDSYSKNDHCAAPELELKQGDLVLRDRGYSKAEEIKRHIDAGAHFIYRHKFKTLYIDPASGEFIDLNKLLKRKGTLDMEVYLNNKSRTKVRLIATPVNRTAANQRRRKAKQEMKGHNPSSGLLYQMNWTIFITNVSKDKADFQKILLMYGLRWRIETIFKTWKSHMQFAHIHNVSENHLRTLLIARFIMIVIYMQCIYFPLNMKIYEKYKREVSMVKLLKYLTKNPEKLTELLFIQTNNNESQLDDSHIHALLKYCTFDKRKRPNFRQLMVREMC